MRRFSGPRKTANFSESIHQQLNMYALAASATGVGVLALLPPAEYALPAGAALLGAFVLSGVAEAKIVYTPAHIRINSTFSLDVNHDGIVDYKIRVHQYSHMPFSTFWSMRVQPNASNQIVSHPSHGSNCFAAALPAGVRLGAKRLWKNCIVAGMVGWGTNLHGGTSHSGPWFDVQHRYLGLKFIIHGKFHYGWARLNVEMGHDQFDAVLTGYAYETIPNKPITTGNTIEPNDSVEQPDNLEPDASLAIPIQQRPQPASLGMLAFGAHGLTIWRRKESAIAAQGS
jgi:hypothetical protein